MQEVCDDLANGINQSGLEKKYGSLTDAIAEKRKQEITAVKNNTTIIDRLAICRLEEKPYRLEVRLKIHQTRKKRRVHEFLCFSMFVDDAPFVFDYSNSRNGAHCFS